MVDLHHTLHRESPGSTREEGQRDCESQRWEDRGKIWCHRCSRTNSLEQCLPVQLLREIGPSPLRDWQKGCHCLQWCGHWQLALAPVDNLPPGPIVNPFKTGHIQRDKRCKHRKGVCWGRRRERSFRERTKSLEAGNERCGELNFIAYM